MASLEARRGSLPTAWLNACRARSSHSLASFKRPRRRYVWPRLAADMPRSPAVREVSQLRSKRSSACWLLGPWPAARPASYAAAHSVLLFAATGPSARQAALRDTYIASAIVVRIRIPPPAGDTSGSQYWVPEKSGYTLRG